jgi:hypothetical protein
MSGKQGTAAKAVGVEESEGEVSIVAYKFNMSNEPELPLC